MRTLPILSCRHLVQALQANQQSGFYKNLFPLQNACQDIGFFYLTDYQTIFPEHFDRLLFKRANDFFNQSPCYKNKFRMTENSPGRGYQSLGVNITQGKFDLHESVDFMREEKEIKKKDFVFSGKNAKPVELWPFPFQEYVKGMQKIGSILMEALLPRMLPTFTKPWWGFRVISYPVGGVSDLGCGEHCDYGFLTLVLQDYSSDSCLEVKTRDGKWIPVPSLPNTLVVNIGDMLQFCSNGIYKSTPHRVQSPRIHNRLSIPFFFDPNYDATFVDKNGKTILYSQHLKSKIATNYN